MTMHLEDLLIETNLVVGAGTENPEKIEAVKVFLRHFLSTLGLPEMITKNVDPKISNSPVFPATLFGAVNRAVGMHTHGAHLGIGQEGGRIWTPRNEIQPTILAKFLALGHELPEGSMIPGVHDMAVLSWDGGHRIGRSSIIPLPRLVVDFLHEHPMELGPANDHLYDVKNSKQKGGAGEIYAGPDFTRMRMNLEALMACVFKEWSAAEHKKKALIG